MKTVKSDFRVESSAFLCEGRKKQRKCQDLLKTQEYKQYPAIRNALKQLEKIYIDV